MKFIIHLFISKGFPHHQTLKTPKNNWRFEPLTIERDSQKETVGDVHHDTAQKIQHVHVSRRIGELVQEVKLFIRGADGQVYRFLETGTWQS